MLLTRSAGVGAVVVAVALAHVATGCLAGAEEPPGETTPEPPAPTSPPAREPVVFQPPRPAAGEQRADNRQAMVLRQIAHPADGRTPVRDKAVLEAMRKVPRHVFVPQALRNRAYQDTPLPIGNGQTISQPYIVALMTELLGLTPESKVLEIGTGSGYQAAVLAHLTPNVHTVEIIEPLAERAQSVLAEQGYEQVKCLRADGYHGWSEHAPYDAIIVTCAAGHLPPPLWEQVRPGGRIVIPIGGPYELQRLVVVEKQADGSRRTRTITAVRFVPLTRQGER
jgi:protein-L-isoaspartate(D-aspartate) O-methyltransferase